MNKAFKRTLTLFCPLTAALFFAACKSGPDYHRPDVSDLSPGDWRWKIAQPADATPRGDWWTAFDDPELNRLEDLALDSNPSLSAASARVLQARAAVSSSRSQLFPTVEANATTQRQRLSGNRPLPIPTAMELDPMYQNAHSGTLDALWEADLWGRIRRTIEAAQARLQVSVADLENLRLILTAELATDYFTLRAKDEEINIIRKELLLKKENANILQNRFENGLIAEIDTVQAKSSLAASEGDLAATQQEQARLFIAIAQLCGTAPSKLEIAPAETPLPREPQTLSAGLPADLLERRPDVAAAERRLAARNAEIGVARAAYFPNVSLTGSTGFLSDEVGNLFAADSAAWGLAPQISLPLFTAGRTRADVQRARAAYDEAMANYRQSLLAAFADVENALASIRFLTEQNAAQEKAVGFAQKTAELADQELEAGTRDHLNANVAKVNLLEQERVAVRLKAQRHAACVRLTKAVGGGWRKGMPTDNTIP